MAYFLHIFSFFVLKIPIFRHLSNRNKSDKIGWFIGDIILHERKNDLIEELYKDKTDSKPHKRIALTDELQQLADKQAGLEVQRNELKTSVETAITLLNPLREQMKTVVECMKRFHEMENEYAVLSKKTYEDIHNDMQAIGAELMQTRGLLDEGTKLINSGIEIPVMTLPNDLLPKENKEPEEPRSRLRHANLDIPSSLVESSWEDEVSEETVEKEDIPVEMTAGELEEEKKEEKEEAAIDEIPKGADLDTIWGWREEEKEEEKKNEETAIDEVLKMTDDTQSEPSLEDEIDAILGMTKKIEEESKTEPTPVPDPVPVVGQEFYDKLAGLMTDESEMTVVADNTAHSALAEIMVPSEIAALHPEFSSHVYDGESLRIRGNFAQGELSIEYAVMDEGFPKAVPILTDLITIDTTDRIKELMLTEIDKAFLSQKGKGEEKSFRDYEDPALEI